MKSLFKIVFSSLLIFSLTTAFQKPVSIEPVNKEIVKPTAFVYSFNVTITTLYTGFCRANVQLIFNQTLTQAHYLNYKYKTYSPYNGDTWTYAVKTVPSGSAFTTGVSGDNLYPSSTFTGEYEIISFVPISN